MPDYEELFCEECALVEADSHLCDNCRHRNVITVVQRIDPVLGLDDGCRWIMAARSAP